ncbi:MAG: Nickel transport protein NikQ [Phycisphaerae bacterium]|nr:Nickel transport protein NikQ [Phycisphaerae bacterium]
MHVPARSLSQDDSLVHRLDARAKLAALLGLVIICVSTPPGRWGAFVFYAVFLLAVAALSRVSPHHLLKRLLAVLPFVVLVAVFLPFMPGQPRVAVGPLSLSRGGLAMFATISTKGLIAVGAVVLLSATTPAAELLAGLARLRVPAIFVMLLAVTWRYLWLLADEARRMKRAAVARGFTGRWLWHARTVGRMIGALFLRSHQRGERVYLAMAARGFDGRAVGVPPARLRGGDLLFAAGSLALLIACRAVLP